MATFSSSNHHEHNSSKPEANDVISVDNNNGHEDDPINDEKEKEHFRQVVESFRLYNFYATKRVTNRLKHYRDLSSSHKSFLFDFEDNCRKLIDCIKHNDQVIDLVLKDVDHMFENTSRDTIENEEKKKSRDLKAHQDVDRVYTTLKQIVRDWSSDGERERACCYGPILNELKNLYPQEANVLGEIKVLVPGAGLGRLAFEIAVLGFKAQGNEFSLHMLIMSNFILNKCLHANQFKLYPYVNTWCNNWSFDSQVKPVHFPDVSPHELISDSFSFAAGDFLDVYVDKDEWDSVVTCFFIDTAHNVIDYVEKIWTILKPNGYWINFGPLLYHFADMPNEVSVELSYEQLKHVIKSVGFKFLKEDLHIPSTYLENTKSMLKYNYECVFFVVQKPSA